MKRRHYRTNPRASRGAAVVYGVFAVAGILTAGVVTVLMLLNVGLTTLNDEKLARVNTFSSQYAAAHAQDGTGEGAVTQFTANLMSTMGVAPNELSVKVAPTDTTAGAGVKVTVANKFGLAASEGIMPTQISLQNTSTSVTGSDN